MFKFEDNIPMPKRIVGRGGSKYDALTQMAVGQSTFVETKLGTGRTQTYQLNKRFPDMRFISRAEGEGVRIWRVK